MFKQTLLSIGLCGTLIAAQPLLAHDYRDLLQKEMKPEALQRTLLLNQKWVPYPAYADRAGWDQFLGANKASLIAQGEKKLGYKWQVVQATDYLEFQKSGSRDIMQDPFNQNNNALAALFFAELAEGKGRFTPQIINGVYYLCEMTSWALSAHLTSQRSRTSLPDHREHYIDLTAGNLGSMLSWIYYFLGKEFDKENPVISIRLRDELQTRILDTYMRESHFWWMAFNAKPETMVNNWNPWCNSNVLQCFMLLENDPKKLAEAVYRTMISVDKFINYTKSDGACEEGPSYWGHAAGKMYDYLQLLSDLTGGKASIFDEAIIKNMGEYISRSYVGSGWVVNFADAAARGGGEAPLIYRYGKAVNSEEMCSYGAFLASAKEEPIKPSVDVFRTLQTILNEEEMAKVTPKHETPDYTWYPETEFCYIRNPKNGFFVAAKGGYNNESHNHNDAGTFSLYVDDQPVLIDAGVGTYTRQTFSGERYSIWTMQSNYHNLPLINGVPQKFGANYKATEVEFSPAKKQFTANIATAYPEEAQVESWKRSYRLDKGGLVIKDNFKLKAAKEKNQIHFLSYGTISLDTPGKVIINVNDKQVAIEYDKQAFQVEKEAVALDDKRLSNVWGDTIYRLVFTAQDSKTEGNYQFKVVRL